MFTEEHSHYTLPFKETRKQRKLHTGAAVAVSLLIAQSEEMGRVMWLLENQRMLVFFRTHLFLALG